MRDQFRSDVMLCDLPEDEEVVGFKMDVKGEGSPTWKIAGATLHSGNRARAGSRVAPGVV